MRDQSFVELRTERLVIRRLKEDDAEAFAAYRDDPNVARLQGWDLPYTVEQAVEFIESLHGLAPGTPGTWFQFAVGTRATGGLIGDIAVHTTAEDPRQAEMGFSFSVAHQGRGYAAEAARAVLGYAVEVLDMRRVFAITDSQNLPAQQLLVRVGFELEQEIEPDSLLYGFRGSDRMGSQVDG